MKTSWNGESCVMLVYEPHSVDDFKVLSKNYCPFYKIFIIFTEKVLEKISKKYPGSKNFNWLSKKFRVE